jgi:hypothetical protein
MPIARRTWSGGQSDRDPKRTNADNKLLLIYPFNVEETELSAAASGLKELGGDLLVWTKLRQKVCKVSWTKETLLKEQKSQKGYIM